jgi:hypothetical protein
MLEVETIDRIVRMDGEGLPVLSLYARIDPDRRAFPSRVDELLHEVRRPHDPAAGAPSASTVQHVSARRRPRRQPAAGGAGDATKHRSRAAAPGAGPRPGPRGRRRGPRNPLRMPAARVPAVGPVTRRGGIAAPTAPSAGSAWRRWSARSPAPATPGRGRSVSAALLCMTRSKVRRPPPAERYPLSASSALVGRLTAPRNALTRLLSGPPHPRGPQQREARRRDVDVEPPELARPKDSVAQHAPTDSQRRCGHVQVAVVLEELRQGRRSARSHIAS